MTARSGFGYEIRAVIERAYSSWLFSSSAALNLPPLSSVYRVRPEFRPLLDAATQRDCLPKQFLPGASLLS